MPAEVAMEARAPRKTVEVTEAAETEAAEAEAAEEPARRRPHGASHGGC